MVWYSHLFQNFPHFIVIHTVKGFGTVNKAAIDVSRELSCFFNDPPDVGNLICVPSAFSKTSLNNWEFTVHVLLKPGLENFEHYFTSMWDEWKCAIVRSFYSQGNENQNTYASIKINFKKHTEFISHLSLWLVSKSEQNTKLALYWWRYEETGTLIHCWDVCLLVQPIWKIIQWFFKKFLISPHLHMYTKELKSRFEVVSVLPYSLQHYSQ